MRGNRGDQAVSRTQCYFQSLRLEETIGTGTILVVSQSYLFLIVSAFGCISQPWTTQFVLIERLCLRVIVPVCKRPYTACTVYHLHTFVTREIHGLRYLQAKTGSFQAKLLALHNGVIPYRGWKKSFMGTGASLPHVSSLRNKENIFRIFNTKKQ